MLKYNSDNIIVGYIKQLLYTFNLPKCKVFKTIDELKSYASGKDRIGIVRKYKDNMDYIIHLNSSNEITGTLIYKFDLYYPNITSTIYLKNNLYDTDCHKYLGNYLRFLRDYKDLNLMSMYNCYSGSVLTDNAYKYIIVPVKYNTKYTIALTANNYYITFTTENTLVGIQNHFKKLTIGTAADLFSYKTQTKFEVPFAIESREATNIFNENNYNMIIRLPNSTNFVLTVLEGDYSSNARSFTKVQFNFDKELDGDYNNVNLTRYLSDFQLLDKSIVFRNESYPIADRLIEYLTDMVIIPGDKISKNVVDAKYKVYTNYGNNYYLENGAKIYPNNHTASKLGILNDSFTNNERIRFLDAIMQTKYKYKNTHDLLGYVDKDIESTINSPINAKGVE